MASGIMVIVFTSILGTIMGVTAMSAMARHYVQAMHVVRGQMEELKGTAFNQITNSNAQASYDAGADHVFGTLDDFQGTLAVAVRDALDADSDGNTAEATIDVNGDGVNDCIDFPACTNPYVKPVRVGFTWSERLWGAEKNITVTLDSLIAQ